MYILFILQHLLNQNSYLLIINDMALKSYLCFGLGLKFVLIKSTILSQLINKGLVACGCNKNKSFM
jgi:hypothetical protein